MDSATSRAAGHAFIKRRDARVEDRDVPANDKVAPAQIAAIEEWSRPVDARFAYLKEIRQPVLVLNGTHDIIYYTANSLHLAQNLPNGRLILYPDAAHGSFFQYPGLFVEYAEHFLRGQASLWTSAPRA